MMEKISIAANSPTAKSWLRGWPTGRRSVCAKALLREESRCSSSPAASRRPVL